MFIEILFKMLLFKGGVLIYAEYCIYIYTHVFTYALSVYCQCPVQFIKMLVRAAVRKFYLFVAISVRKPGTAALSGIIFSAWGCDPAFRQGSSMD